MEGLFQTIGWSKDTAETDSPERQSRTDLDRCGRPGEGTMAYLISEAAEFLGVSVHTLRYYDRIGLLEGVAPRQPRPPVLHRP